MKKLILALVLPLMLLGGCLTSDYNLRTIMDTDRYYEGAYSDSTSTLMKWNTPEWKTDNVKYWRSGGVIITNEYNAFEENSWLADLVSDGFEGQVFVEDTNLFRAVIAFGNMPPFSVPPNRFISRTYQAKLSTIGLVNSVLVNNFPSVGSQYFSNSTEVWPHEANGYWIYKPDQLLTHSGFISSYSTILLDEFSELSTAIGDTEGVVTFGYYLGGYDYQDWDWFNDYLTTVSVDPSAVSVDGVEAWSTTDSSERAAIMDASNDELITELSNVGVDVLIGGDRLGIDYATNTMLSQNRIIGQFYDDVNTTNIATIETSIANLRAQTLVSVQTPRDALMLIAGVKNDVYYEVSPTTYSTLIQRLVNAGMYFTPGAEDDHWNMPMTNPGDWWIRSDDDSNWQDQAPTYASDAVGPRWILQGAEEVRPYDEPSLAIGLGAGGWLEGGAIHPTDNNYMMLGADVNSAYYSTDRGNTWELVTEGMVNREDIHSFYGMDVVGIDNGDFSGFLMSTSGGIYSFDIESGDKTFVNMTPYDDPEGIYVSEVKQGTQTNPWGFWTEAIPFASLYTSPDQKYIVASTGRYRFALNGNILGNIHYPNSYTNVNYSNPVGRQSLWYYWYDDPSGSRWRPLETEYDSWNPDHGVYSSIAMGIAGTDTVVVMASQGKGPQMYNITTKKHTDLSIYPWYDHDGNSVDPATINWGWAITSSNNTQSAESIELSDRMTAYVCVTNDDAASTIKSGVYRMHNVMYPTAWEWIGDQTLMPYTSHSDNVTKWTIDGRAGGQGVGGRGVYNYVTMNEGSGAEADTLWIGERGYIFGISKIIVPYGHGVGYDQQQTWIPGSWLFNYYAEGNQRMPAANFPVNGWNDHDVSTAITFEPMVDPRDANFVVTQPGGALIKTTDGGINWSFMEPRKVNSDLNFSRTGGYEEMCTNDISVLSDGRLIISFGDNGLALSESGSNWLDLDNLNPRVTFISGQNTSTCDSDGSGLIQLHINAGIPYDYIDTDLMTNNDETSDIWVEPNWEGTGRDALFWSESKAIGTSAMGNIIMYHDSDGDGEWETTSVTTEAVAVDRWKYGYFFGYTGVRTGNDFDFYISYREATTSACVGDWSAWGVHQLHYNSTTDTWTRTDLNNFNDEDWGGGGSGNATTGLAVTPYDLVHSSAENKLYVSTSIFGGTFGSVWEYDLDDPVPMWVEILGKNSFDTTPPASDSRNDVKSPIDLEISADGSTLYVANSGYQSGQSGIWKVTDLDNDVLDGSNQPNWTSPTVEFMLNNPTLSTAWGIFPPERYGEILTDRGRNDIYENAWLDAEFSAVLVNPDNADQIWYTIESRHRNHPDNGVWAYDTIRNVLVQVSNYESIPNSGAGLSDENIYMDTVHSPWRIIVGTDCNGVYWMNYDRVFHTDKETETKPLLTPDTSQEYPPNGVYAIAGDGEVNVYWNITPNYNQNGLNGYYVYRGTISGSLTKLSGLLTRNWNGDTHISYNDATAVNDTEYFYAITTNYSPGGESALSTETKSTPRENRLVTNNSSEDFHGTTWRNDNTMPEVTTFNPFGQHKDAITAHGWESNGSSATGAQIISTSRAIDADGDNWALISAYVKGTTNSLTNNHISRIRLYDGSTTLHITWWWQSDGTLLLDTGLNDAQGSYSVGDGWHRVWFKVDLNTRGLTAALFDIRIVPYGTENAVGNGMYVWGLNSEFTTSEPTELCAYIPVLPIVGTYTIDPPYWGDEKCVTLEPTTPAAPANLTVDDYASNSIEMSYDTVADTDYYNVYRGQTTGGQEPLPFTFSTSTSFNDVLAVNYEPYYYTVSATNSDGVEGAESTEEKYYANEWLHGGEQSGDCVSSRDVNLVTPNFGDPAVVGVDSGSVDFTFVHDESTGLNHIFQITGEFLYWQDQTSPGDVTHFEHYTSTTLEPDSWTRHPDIELQDANYAITNVWAPHCFQWLGKWYMSYTAIDNTVGSVGLAVQRIMMVESDDLMTWTDNTLLLGRGWDIVPANATPEDNIKGGVTNFMLWANGVAWENSMRDASIIRNPANNGWLMFVPINGDPAETILSGMIIGIAESLDADNGGKSIESLTGEYYLYDWIENTSTAHPGGGGDAESPCVWEENGVYYVHTSTNGGSGSQNSKVTTSTTPNLGTRLGGTWTTPVQMNYKAPEMLKVSTGEYIMPYLKNGWVGNAAPTNGWEYYHINFKRIYMYPDGTWEVSNIVTSPCFDGTDLFYDNGPVPNQ